MLFYTLSLFIDKKIKENQSEVLPGLPIKRIPIVS